jgi:hypothetical protein
MKSKLITTAQVVLYINGKPYANVSGFRWESATPPKVIYGLDSGEPYELAPATTRVTGIVQLYRQVGSGGLEGAGVIAPFESLPRSKYFSLSLVERSTDTQIFRADNCWAVSQSWDAPVKGRITGAISFEGLTWSNEAQSR